MKIRRQLMGVAAALVAASTACTLEQRTDGPASRQAPVAEAPAGREVVNPEGVARMPVFSSAVRTGDLLFLSGAIGTLQDVAQPTLVEGGIDAETRQTMANIVSVLEAEGLGLDDVVKCTVFLADIAEYGAMNEVYLSFFPVDPPARSALAATGLALGARVEIECIAAYPPGE